MTIDWFVLLSPLPVAVIALLFLFVGCKPFGSNPQTPPTTPVPNPPTIAPTILQLNPAPNLQQLLHPNLPPRDVTKIKVTFVLSIYPPVAGVIDLLNIGEIKRADNGPIVATDATSVYISQPLDDATIGTRNRVRCECVVTLTGPAGGTSNVNADSLDAVLNKNGMNKFWLEPEAPQNPNTTNPQRRFRVIFDTAGK